MRTQTYLPVKENQKDTPIKPPDLAPIIDPHWLELPLSRTNFHGPEGVRATEVRLYSVAEIIVAEF